MSLVSRVKVSSCDPSRKIALSAEKCRELGFIVAAMVGEPQPARRQPLAHKLPTYAHQQRHGELDLMPIQMTGDADITELDSDICARTILQRQALIGD